MSLLAQGYRSRIFLRIGILQIFDQLRIQNFTNQNCRSFASTARASHRGYQPSVHPSAILEGAACFVEAVVVFMRQSQIQPHTLSSGDEYTDIRISQCGPFDAGDVWEVSRSISRVLIEGYRGICIMMPVGQHFTKMVPESIGKNMLVRCLFLWMTWGLVLLVGRATRICAKK